MSLLPAAISKADSGLIASVCSTATTAGVPHDSAGLASLTELQASERGIASLKGIETLRSLRAIDLSGNQIANLTPLAALDSLQMLDLSDNRIADLTPLATLSKLQVLLLSRNRVEDPSPLLSLLTLEEVDLTGNPMTAASVSSVVSVLRNRNTKVALSIEPWTGSPDPHLLQALAEALGVPAAELLTTDPEKLRSLTASGREITRLDGIERFTSLEVLNLAGNEIEDLSPLRPLISLRELDLTDNQVQDLSPLAALRQLELLMLNGNRVVDLAPLLVLRSLYKLELIGNPLSAEALASQVSALEQRETSVILSILPSAARIAFVSDRRGEALYSMNEDGTDQRLLVSMAALLPAWAPDGERLAFSAAGADSSDDIWLIRNDGTELRAVANTVADELCPSWLPDGLRLGFLRTSSRYQLVEADLTTGEEALVPLHSIGLWPSWSPDGTTIAYISYSAAEDRWGLYLSDTRTGVGTQLTSDAAYALSRPAWSPDGLRLAFVSARDGNLEIYSIRSDGTELQRLTNDPGVDEQPTWSPDGTRLAFSSSRGKGYDIFCLDLGSGQLTNLTNHRGNDTMPAWSPVPPLSKVITH